MAVDETIFGELDENGKIVRDVRFCAETGIRIQAGDARIKVAGTRYFYWVKAQVYKKLTPERRQEIEAPVRPTDMAAASTMLPDPLPIGWSQAAGSNPAAPDASSLSTPDVPADETGYYFDEDVKNG